MDTGAKGRFYVNGGLRFMGDSYTAMKMFIAHSGNDPDVMKEFRPQLEMREQVKWKKEDEKKKEEERNKQAESKSKPKPTKKPVTDKYGRSHSRLGNAAARFKMTR